MWFNHKLLHGIARDQHCQALAHALPAPGPVKRSERIHGMQHDRVLGVEPVLRLLKDLHGGHSSQVPRSDGPDALRLPASPGICCTEMTWLAAFVNLVGVSLST